MPSTLRYLREYLRPDAERTSVTETEYTRDGEVLPATVYRPRRQAGRLPGWVVLHGLTYSGRAHTGLVRFARSVAAAGNLVLVPDIPEWRALRLDPAITNATIRAAVYALQQRDDVDHGRAGLFGFSFGATQALIAAADPDVRALLHGVAAWGGYADVERLFVHGMTGEHELDGVMYHAEPDPYGSWIIAGQYLAATPGHEDDGDVAAALHGLALEAGRRRVYAGDPSFDDAKAAARATLPRAKHELFDVIAPPTGAPARRTSRGVRAGVPARRMSRGVRAGSGQPPRDTGLARRLALELAATALRCDPLIDPRPVLADVRTPILLAHGRDDRLIPFTETIRLSRGLTSATVRRCTITSLFAHSGGTRPGLGVLGLARETARFYGLLRGLLSLL